MNIREFLRLLRRLFVTFEATIYRCFWKSISNSKRERRNLYGSLKFIDPKFHEERHLLRRWYFIGNYIWNSQSVKREVKWVRGLWAAISKSGRVTSQGQECNRRRTSLSRFVSRPFGPCTVDGRARSGRSSIEARPLQPYEAATPLSSASRLNTCCSRNQMHRGKNRASRL